MSWAIAKPCDTHLQSRFYWDDEHKVVRVSETGGITWIPCNLDCSDCDPIPVCSKCRTLGEYCGHGMQFPKIWKVEDLPVMQTRPMNEEPKWHFYVARDDNLTQYYHTSVRENPMAEVNETFDREDEIRRNMTMTYRNEIQEGVEMPVEFTSAVINVKELARLSKEHNVMISFNISPIDFEEDEESE